MLWLSVSAPSQPLASLPIADRSASLLVEALLADEAAAVGLLVEVLKSDPPFAAWAAARVQMRDGAPADSPAECARRSAGDLLDSLLEAGTADAAERAPGPDFVQRVERDFRTAFSSAAVAEADGPEAVEIAYFQGLLYRAAEWCPGGATSWSLAASSAAPHVREAVARWECNEHGSADSMLKTGRVRATAARKAWAAPLPGAGRTLVALVRRLARLRDLETRFDALLESEKLDAMAELAAGAGHEINNPLATISGRAQLLLRDESNPERRRELAVIHAQARRANEMIADMRLFTRPPQPRMETLDPALLVRRVVEESAPSAAERGVAITMGPTAGDPTLEADPAQLNVVVHALCRNALEAIADRGRIEWLVCGRETEVELQVVDNGSGIDPEHRRHIFDPFFSSRQAGRGLGMGLSKCRRIVTNHGGRIEVASEPGRGTMVTVVLPKRPAKSEGCDS